MCFISPTQELCSRVDEVVAVQYRQDQDGLYINILFKRFMEWYFCDFLFFMKAVVNELRKENIKGAQVANMEK